MVVPNLVDRMRKGVDVCIVIHRPAKYDLLGHVILSGTATMTKILLIPHVFVKKFRRRFRCSYVSYLKHVEEVKSSELFSAWMSRDCVGKESSPLSCLFWAVSVTLDEDGASMILKSRRVSVRRHGCR